MRWPSFACIVLLLCPVSSQIAQAAQDIIPPVAIEELTWPEVRDAIKAGKTTAILPVGGTEQNGYHMAVGKHNFIIKYTAEEIARRLGNALVAPVVTYVPEGDIERLPSTCAFPVPSRYLTSIS